MPVNYIEPRTLVAVQISNGVTNPKYVARYSTMLIRTFVTFNAADYVIDSSDANSIIIEGYKPVGFLLAAILMQDPSNGAKTAYTIDLTLNHSLPNGSFVSVRFPAQIQRPPTGLSKCFSETANLQSQIPCSLEAGDNNVTAQLLLHPEITSRNYFSAGESVRFTIPDVSNCISYRKPDLFSLTASRGKQEYSQVAVYQLQTLSPGKVLDFQGAPLRAQFVFGVSATWNFYITLTNAVPTSGMLRMRIPPSLTMNTPDKSECTNLGQQFSSWAQSEDGYEVNLTVAYSATKYQFSITNILHPTSEDLTHFFQLMTFDVDAPTKQQYLMDYSDNQLRAFALPCDLPCKLCASARTACTACYSASATTKNDTLHETLSMCLEVCPLGYFTTFTPQLEKICASCNLARCRSCVDSDTNCTSCNPGTYFFEN